jgi:hypothetical protein
MAFIVTCIIEGYSQQIYQKTWILNAFLCQKRGKINQQNSDLGHATGKCLPGIGSGDVSKWCLKQSWGQGCGQDMVHKIMTVNNGYLYIYLILMLSMFVGD